jgi:hypothetical protein
MMQLLGLTESFLSTDANPEQLGVVIVPDPQWDSPSGVREPSAVRDGRQSSISTSGGSLPTDARDYPWQPISVVTRYHKWRRDAFAGKMWLACGLPVFTLLVLCGLYMISRPLVPIW